MIPAQRRQAILAIAERNGGVAGISDLIKELGVSHMTVRRDIQKLEADGLVFQVSGGIELSRKLQVEPSHATKEGLASEEKKRIGRKASEMIPEHSCIYLDAGTTSLALAQYIAPRSDLTVITNDFEVLNYLMERTKSQLIHVGGQVLKENRSTVGPLATRIISSLAIDIAFMSASSWDVRGATTPDIGKVEVKQAVLEASRRHVLICDSSKYGQVATFIAFKLSDLDAVVTDTALPEQACKLIRNMDIELVTA